MRFFHVGVGSQTMEGARAGFVCLLYFGARQRGRVRVAVRSGRHVYCDVGDASWPARVRSPALAASLTNCERMNTHLPQTTFVTRTTTDSHIPWAVSRSTVLYIHSFMSGLRLSLFLHYRLRVCAVSCRLDQGAVPNLVQTLIPLLHSSRRFHGLAIVKCRFLASARRHTRPPGPSPFRWHA